MYRWRNKVAIVTAVNSRVGVEIAAYLATAGMKVVGLATEGSVNVPDDVQGKFHMTICDNLYKPFIIKTFAQIEEKFGYSDLLVNNALFYNPFLSNIDTINYNSFKTITDKYEKNLLSMILFTKEALHSMKRRSSDGHVININSFDRQNTEKMKNPHPALAALTEMLQLELPENSGVKITNIETGHVTAADPLVETKGQFMPYLVTHDICDAIRFSLEISPNMNVQEIILKPFGAG